MIIINDGNRSRQAAHLLAKPTAEFFRDSFGDGHRSNTAWLGASNLAFHRVTRLGKILGDLSRLARTRFTDHYQHLIVVNGLQCTEDVDHVNSASYPERDGKWVVACGLRGEGLVWLIGAVVCLLAANRGSNRSLTRAMDGRPEIGRIVRCAIISSCQSAATSDIVKRFWSRVWLM